MRYEVDEKITFMHKAMCKIDKIYNTLLKQAKMTDSEFTMLFYMIASGRDCTQKDIAENTYISPKTLNSTVKKLEQKGIVELKPGKYPFRYVKLTQKGIEYAKDNIIPVIESERRTLENMPQADLDNIENLAIKYIRIFEQSAGINSDEP